MSFVSAVVFLISIHAPREGSDTVALDVTVLGDISIHAPREGSDSTKKGMNKEAIIFQSTLPVKGATEGLE